MKFVYKICLACGIVCLVNICTDRSCTSDDLIYKYASAFASIHLITDGDDT